MPARARTFGEDTLTWTMMGAKDVLRSCAGWLMVSASRTTSCRERANSKILSISLCTSAEDKRRTMSRSPGPARDWRWGRVRPYPGWSGCWTFR